MTKSSTIIQFYNDRLKQFGKHDYKSVAWQTFKDQDLRFKILTDIADLDGCSILDVGCGLGDLYIFLRNKRITYTGIDFSSELTHVCTSTYKNISIITADFLKYTFPATYDYVLCSGALNIAYPNHNHYIQAAIKKMYTLCNKGVAFNLPSNMGDWIHDTSLGRENIALKYVDPLKIFQYCKSFCSYVTLRHDYLIDDFTIYLYKNSIEE